MSIGAIRRAHFDASTWEAVPQNERDAASRAVLGAYQKRIGAAVEVGTFDQELDRHLSWDAIVLDQKAWRQVGERLDVILSSLVTLEHEAARRLLAADEEGIPTVIGLAAFRSPETPSEMLNGAYRQIRAADAIDLGTIDAVSPTLAKALSNRWRCRIFSEVSICPLSPSQFVERFGGTMTNISRCFRELAAWDLLEISEERNGGRRGGGVERIYKSTWRPYFDAPTWEALPRIVRDEISMFLLDTYFARVTEAIQAGTFDADTDRHLSWKPILIDRHAWINIGESLDEILDLLPELEAQSLERTADVESLIPTTVGLAAFRSPSTSDSDV